MWSGEKLKVFPAEVLCSLPASNTHNAETTTWQSSNPLLRMKLNTKIQMPTTLEGDQWTYKVLSYATSSHSVFSSAEWSYIQSLKESRARNRRKRYQKETPKSYIAHWGNKLRRQCTKKKSFLEILQNADHTCLAAKVIDLASDT